METVKRSAVAKGKVKEGCRDRAQRIFRAVKLFCTILQW
jgi:hypothetical protein